MFEYKGQQYSLQQLQDFASKNNVDFDQYMANMRKLGMKEAPAPLPEDKGFIEDIVQVFNQATSTAGTIDEAFDIYKIGNDLSDDQLASIIEAANKMDQYGPTNEQVSFANDQKKYGGGIFGTLRALYDNPGFVPQFLVSSSVIMASSLQSGEVRGSTAASAGVGAAGGAAIGSTGFTLGPLGAATTAAGAITGATSGAIGGLIGSMETGLTLMELLQEEIGVGVELTKENIRAVLEDTEKLEKIKQRAVARGRNIGAVEALTFGISRGVGSQLVRAGKFRRATVATTGIETTGGFVGEVAGQIGAEQEIDLGEATLEAIGELTGPGQIINVGEIVRGTLQKSEYNINGEKRSKQEILDLINSDKLTAEEKSKIKFNVKNDAKFASLIDGKLKDIYLETQIDAKVEDPGDRQALVDLEKQRAKAELDTKKSGIFTVPGATTRLENIEKQINEIVGKYTAIDGRTSEVRARKKSAEEVVKARRQMAVDDSRENIEKFIKEGGLQGQVNEMTSNEISESVLEREAELRAEIENAKDEKQKKAFEQELQDIGKADKQFGFILQSKDGSFEVVLNKDKPALGTAAHEFMHAVLFKTIGNDTNIQDSLGDALIEHTSKIKGDKTALVNRLSAYGRVLEDGTFVRDANFGEETITIMSESILDGSLKFEENFFTKIGDLIRQTLQRYGLRKIKFNTGRDVYNFVKDYSRSVKEGRIDKSIINLAKKGAKGKLIPKKADPKATIQMSKEASDNVQRIYDDVGEAGAMDIIDQFKPIVNKIVDKRKDAPNFDRQLLTDEIETGKRGIFDLIREYDPKSGVPLAAYINKFLPARAIEASKRVLGEEFTQDVTEKVDIAAEEVTTEVKAKPKPKKIVLADRLGITEKVSKAINKIVPILNIDKLSFKTVKNEIPEIVGELFGISPKKLRTNANITKGELQKSQMFISKNADLLINMLPEGATASGTATGVPKSLLQAFYTKTDRAKMAKTGSKAGLAVQQKNDINRKQFLEVFGIVDGKPNRDDRNTSARVLALANTLGKMITNQAIRQEEASIKLTTEAVAKLEDGKSTVMFSKQGLKNNLNKHTGEQMLDPKNGNNRKTFKSFVEKTLPKYVIPYVGADTFGPNTSLEKNIKQGYFNSAAERNSMKQNAIKNRKALKNKNKLKTKHTLIQEQQMQGFVKDKRNSGFTSLFTPGYNKTIEDHFKGAEIYFKGLSKAWQDGHAPEVTAILQSSPAASGHIMRILGLPKGLHKDVKVVDKGKLVDKTQTNPKNKPTKEHTLQNSEATDMMAQAIAIGPKAVERLTKYFKKHYYMIGLSFKDTAKVDQHFKDNQPQEFQNKLNKVFIPYLKGEVGIDQMPDPMMKMVHPKVNATRGGIDLDNITMNDGKTARKKYFGASNENIFRYLNDEVSIDYLKQSGKVKLVKNTENQVKIADMSLKARTTSYSKQSKGITVLDFDDTLATTESLVKYTAPDGETGTLNAEQFASTYQDLQDQGYTFDFSDFNRVVKGKLAPLFNKALKLQKKFGPENMFVLTARPPAAQKPIFDFLKANGLNIPLKNITGLGNSTSEAKALWMADKVAEGYNDFYFADDALQNVQAVKNMLDQFDVKSKIQQAKIKFSKDMDSEFNKILQDVTGIESKKRYSQTKARKRGEGKGKFRFFVPPSHEDFAGLLYNFMGKGEQGNKHREFFEQALLKPLNRAYQELTAAKQAIATDYKNLIKQFPDLRKKLTKKTPDGDYYYSDAVRVYLWDKAGFEIPGTSKTDVKELSDLVKNDPELQAFADTIGKISRMDEGYIEPGEHWEAGDIRTDLADATGRVGRAKFFNEFQENADIIFSQENLNKIEAAYGPDFRAALQDILYRTKNGTNRTVGQNKIVNGFLDYLNGSIGATMFFNARSAVLQTLSTVNFINFGDNNIFKAAAAFANQPQFWKDFSMIFNSDVLKQRRAGVAFDINANEIASAVGKSKTAAGKVRAAIKYLLQIGFLPTQMADSFAISLGGASMYRNRVNTYKSQGLSQKEAEAKAFTDFQEISEATQQSARPDMISQQQASVLGRLILAFQNTPSQYVRLIKKAGLDLINRRKTKPYTSQVKSDMSNISRIIYYGAVQNIIFGALQTALFAMLFSEDDEEDEKTQKFFKTKRDRVINGTIDTILRGSGVAGAIVSTIKNGLIKYHENQGKKWNKQLDTISEELIQLSPPIGIKKRKLDGFEKTLEYNKKVIPEMDTFDIDNPVWYAYAQLIEGATNIPVARLHRKVENVRAALNSENEWWQRLAVGLGWSKWDVGIENKEVEAVKEKIKKQKKKKKSFGGTLGGKSL
jgi:uncharacterized protein (DUF2461 family)